MAIPTQLGGTVQTLVTPQTRLQEIERATPGLVAYAVKVCQAFSLRESMKIEYTYICKGK